MVDEDVAKLRHRLLGRLTTLFTSETALSHSVHHLLAALELNHLSVALFGGTIRDLALFGSRYAPRDLDIVVDGVAARSLEPLLRRYLVRQTRFGGWILDIDGWRVDLWPLEDTWAFRENLVKPPTLEQLPRTTFLNVEAIAIQLHPVSRKPRITFESKFFHGLLQRTLDLNLVTNPYPQLSVVRCLVTADRLGFGLSRGLVQYIQMHAPPSATEELVRVQYEHYGRVRITSTLLKAWLEYLNKSNVPEGASLRLPPAIGDQLSLFGDLGGWR